MYIYIVFLKDCKASMDSYNTKFIHTVLVKLNVYRKQK